ncbi:MAG: pseudouridine synthase [Rikenellaceae bacterium]
MFHNLDSTIEPPQLFTNPFDYAPHPLVIEATRHLNSHLSDHPEWVAEGKMFGVLVVRNDSGELGFLAAFSGNLAGATTHPYFVPPIFDLQSVCSFFKAEEAEITAINQRIQALEESPKYRSLEVVILQKRESNQQRINTFKEQIKRDKQERKTLRERGCTPEKMAQLQRESQHQKAELKRLERQLNSELAELDTQATPSRDEITRLKRQRHQLSIALQRKIFDHYRVLNHRGETKSMTDIFAEALGTLPPAGAGECAAPKLLQYAFANNLQIIALGEFWSGRSPHGEVRHHGHYYPACQSKCRYILGYMLDGLPLAKTPYSQKEDHEIEVIYSDDDIAIINKPAGILSQKGKDDNELSLEAYFPRLFPQHTDIKAAHRLDMDTSGLLIIALNSRSYATLQAQFADREVKKRYVALLDGSISDDVGEIDLQIIADIEDRPRQKVDRINGKVARTTFEVVEREGGKTRLNLYPHTGRTHQLRVHCSHSDGLNSPIIGDRLYGSADERLMLHATEISFRHPTTDEEMNFICEPDF